MTLTINIAYVIMDTQKSECISLSKKRLNEKYSSKIILDTENTLPHITLYKAKFEEENINSVLEVVQQIVSNYKSILIPFLRFEKIFDWGVYVQYEKTKELFALHQDLIEQINSLRNEWIWASRWRDQDFLTPKHEEYQDKYGSYFILDYFQPHVTCGLIDSEISFDPESFDISDTLKSINIDKVAICIGWNNWRVVEVLDSFNLW